MKFPKKLKIGGLTYAVTFVRRIIGNDGERAGEICYLSNEIRLIDSLSAEGRWLTLIHESLHGLSYGLPIEQHLTEEQVTVLAPWLYQFMVDNGFLKVEPLTEYAERARMQRLADSRGDGWYVEPVSGR